MPMIADLPEPLADALRERTLRRLTLSERRPGTTSPLVKVQVRPIELQGETAWQFTLHEPQKALHENLAPAPALRRLAQLLHDTFRQVHWSTGSEDSSARPPRQPGQTWQLHRTPAGLPPPRPPRPRTIAPKTTCCPRGFPAHSCMKWG